MTTSTAQKKLKAVVKPSSERNTNEEEKKIEGTVSPEIVIALCGPLGTPLHSIANIFKELLESSDYAYTSINPIKLSDLIRENAKIPDEKSIEKLIDAGNTLRKEKGNSILAKLAVQKISLAREKDQQDFNEKIGATENDAIVPTVTIRSCHIIDSIKHIDELKLLKSIYGDLLHVVGVYSPINERIQQIERIKHPNDKLHELIDRDSGEEIASGQRVSDTFPLSDFFMRVDSGTDSQKKDRVKRFLDLMLGTQVITPTPNERAMYSAYSAARNSACLSRQVGAAITSSDGSIISTGWNDVPKPLGGLYENEGNLISKDSDHRCWNIDGGQCFNDIEKNKISENIINKLVKNNIISDEKKQDAFRIIRSDTELKTLIEFSRAVHAEMHALLNAGSTNGEQIKGGKIFVTTYPCHACARHIVASGISEIYFLEPYRKSLATKLHSDSLTEKEDENKKVKIIPFDGVAPSRYLDFFSMGATGRKGKDGKMLKMKPFPVTASTMEAVSTLEGIVVNGLQSAAENGTENQGRG